MVHSDEVEYVLRTIEERGIRFIRLWFTDVLGFLKAFTITSQELEGAFAEGMGFDGSSIDGFSRIQESDMVAVPDPATFQLIPWKTEAEVARMFCDVLNPDGSPFEGDPRFVLKKQLKRAADLGYTFYVGPELEYFYFKGVNQPEFLDQGGYFDETPLDLATDWRKRTVAYLESMGIPVEYVHHEVAPSQHEIDLRYTDALTMADNVMTYRLTVKEVAQEFGIYATFMPKPVQGVNGSGMHTHQSLFTGDRNAFFGEGDEYHLSTLGKHYIAGILSAAREITLVTNQWVNSYKRLVPGYEAPVYVCWARRNRSALVRVPQYKPGNEQATRIEYRSPDPACNPYLAFASMLGAVHSDGSVGPPQFVTVTVSELPAPADSEAVNCFTRAGAAPLMLGAATRAAIRSKALATKASLPRLESNGLSTDMSCPFFRAGHSTRLTLLPRKLARDLGTDVTSQRSPSNWGQGRVGQMADIVNVRRRSFGLQARFHCE